MTGKDLTRKLDHTLAAPMYGASLVVLALLAALLHMHELEYGGSIIRWCVIGLALMYPLFWLETAAHVFYAKSRFTKQHVWFCLLPILRIGARDHESGEENWLPRLGWREANRPYERMLARKFSIPMIAIALMVLPIIVMEFFYKDFVDSSPGWHLAMKIAEAFIWSAFTYEFIVMISVVKYPLSYAKKHWIDLAIILLPMLAFIRAMRLASLMRIKQLSRTARVFRLRGLGMRMWRGFVALEIVEMLLSRDPERRLEKLEVQLEDRIEEIDLLKKDIKRLKVRVEKQKREQEEKEARENAAASENHDSDTGKADHHPDDETDLIVTPDKQDPAPQDGGTPPADKSRSPVP